MSEILELPLTEVNEWLTKETDSVVNPIKAEAKKLLEDIKNRLEELSEACDKLLEDAEKEMARGSRKTYRRAKFLYKLAGSFSDLIEKVNMPEEINGKSLNETLEQLTKIVDTIGQEKTKWFRALAPYFIISRRRFEASFKRVEDPFRNFTEFLSKDYTKVERIENVPSKIEEIQQASVELNKYQAAKESREKQKEILNKKITESQQKVEAIQSKEELVELAQLDGKIEELTETVKHELRHVQKPLLKFQTLVNNPGYSLVPEANSKLDEYLTNPFNALSTEKDGFPLLKTILQKIDSALDNKKMKLKSSRLRKAKDQINNIVNKAALTSLQIECKQLFSKKRELLASGAISECKDVNAELHDCLKDLQTKLRLLEIKDTRLAKEHVELLQRVEGQKKILETILSEVSDKKVQLILE